MKDDFDTISAAKSRIRATNRRFPKRSVSPPPFRTFLSGVGSVLDIGATAAPPRFPQTRPNRDRQAVASDWDAVAADFRRVLIRLKDAK